MRPAQARELALTAPRNLMREEKRSEHRVDCGGQRATLFVGGRASVALVINLSERGAMLETSAKADLDEHVVIAIDAGTPLHASVRWVKDGRIGLNFARKPLLA